MLFDADDTLLDYEKAAVAALRRLLFRYGAPCGEREERIFTALCNRLWSEYGLDRTREEAVSRRYHTLFFDYSVRRFALFKEAVPVAATAEQLSGEYLDALSDCGDLTEGAYEICRSLAGSCRLCVISNGLWDMQKRRFERSPLHGLISNLIVSERARWAKPSRAFFEYALREAGVSDRSRALVVGDSLVNDIGGAAALGIDTCWLNSSGRENREGVVPTYEIGSLRELAAIFHQTT